MLAVYPKKTVAPGLSRATLFCAWAPQSEVRKLGKETHHRGDWSAI